MVTLTDIVEYCDARTNRFETPDFTGSFNGLQLENDGNITKIGAAVDAGLLPFQLATEKNIDFLIVHHGLFWTPPVPLTDSNYAKIKHCIQNNLAIYSSHLPLDNHPEIGNNKILADKLNLQASDTFLSYEGVDVGLIVKNKNNIKELKVSLDGLFPKGFHSLLFGSSKPDKIAVLTGSGQSAIKEILSLGIDTLITGELKQHHFNLAQEKRLNIFLCGHYATETFGVNELGKEISIEFDLPYEFIDLECPI